MRLASPHTLAAQRHGAAINITSLVTRSSAQLLLSLGLNLAFLSSPGIRKLSNIC